MSLASSKIRLISAIILVALLVLFLNRIVAGTRADPATDTVPAPKLLIQLGHLSIVTSVAFSPDGRFCLTGSGDATLKLWELASGRELRTFRGHGATVNAVAFSPDGRRALSGSGLDWYYGPPGNGNTIKLWDIETGRELKDFGPRQARVNSVAFSPDGKLVVAGTGRSFHNYAPSPGDVRENAILLWDAETGALVKTFSGHTGEVFCVRFSPDGRFLASAGGDETLKLWDVQSGAEIRTFVGHQAPACAVAFSPDGRLLVSGSGRTTYTAGDKMDNTVRLWETATGKLLHTFSGHLSAFASKDSDFARISGVAFAPDGRSVASSSQDGTVRLWNVAPDEKGGFAGGLGTFDGRWKSTFGDLTIHVKDNRAEGTFAEGKGKLSGKISGNTLDGKWTSADGRGPVTFTLSADGRAFTGYWRKNHPDGVWNGEYVGDNRQLKVLAGHSGDVRAVAFSSDGHTLLSGGWDENARLWEVESGKEIRAFGRRCSPVTFHAVSPDGRLLVSGGVDQNLKLWDLTTGGEIRRMYGHTWVTRGAAFSPDGRLIAAGGAGQEVPFVKLWDATTGNVVRTLQKHEASIDRVAFSPDGRLLASSGYDQSIKLWNVETGAELRKLVGHVNPVPALAFSPDGRFIVSGSNDLGGDSKKVLKLWDAATGREIRGFTGTTRGVHDVAYSPDGTTVLTANWDNGLTLWNPETGDEIRRIEEAGSVLSVAFSSDGRRALSGEFGGGVKLWDTATGKRLKTFAGHPDMVSSVSFLPDGRFAVSASRDGTMKFWPLADDANGSARSDGVIRELCTLVSFLDGHWAVVAPDGRFDTDNLDQSSGMHWLMPDDPFHPLPLEIFMREYYEPRLLPRLLAGERFQPVRLLSELNRVQPLVRIASITSDKGDAGRVAVTVEVAEGQGIGANGNARRTGVHDLRLFRDGRLVGHAPERGGEIALDSGTGRATVTFSDIELPRKTDVKSVEFSAYAFNADRIKSATDRRTFTVPASLAPLDGRAYLVCVGVNAYEYSDFDLSFAADDARQIQKLLTEKLSRTGLFKDIVQVPLLSDYEIRDGRHVVTEKTATKQNLKTVFDLLAGKPVAPELKALIPNADRIRPARPEDLVLISCSSHGFTDDAGVFYFVPHDTGTIPEGYISPDLLRRCVSSDELSEWLRDVDADELVLIADACHSAALVGVEGFKPGPMGSRGLGQLSYDKGMRILTATQADNVALENRQIRQGLLTYALLRDGIEAEQADFKPKNGEITMSEWLGYGVDRVPSLYREVRAGKVRSSGEAVKILTLNRKGGLKQPSSNPPDATNGTRSLRLKTYTETQIQRPSLFDFSPRGKRETVLAKDRPSLPN